MSSKSLEGKLEPDWKQWIPVYGPIQIYIDSRAGKPTIMNKTYGAIYHGVSLAAAIIGVMYGLDKLAERLF